MNLKRVICVAITLTLLASAPCWAQISPNVEHNSNLDGAFNTDYVNNPTVPVAIIDWNNVPAIETNPANLTDMAIRVSNQIFSASDPYGMYGLPWEGPGYTSTLAKNNPTANTTIGINTGTDFLSSYGAGTPFFGATVGNNQILMRYTYLGDFNLDGAVDSSDINSLVTGLTHGGDPAYMNYFYGDSNYDQSVDSSDINSVVLGLNTQGSEALAYTPPSTANWPTGGGSITPVPEPSTFVLLILACASGLAAWKKMK